MAPQIQETGITALLRQRSDIWRGVASPGFGETIIATGYPELDNALGGGWPPGLVTEIFSDSPGGVLHLLLPALRKLSREAGWLIWIAPPSIPYPAGLRYHDIALKQFLLVRPASIKERLWAAEHCLRSRACGAVLLWLEHSDFLTSRRLQLAAQDSGAPLFCLLPHGIRDAATATALRLTAQPRLGPHAGPETEAELAVKILKCRSGQAGRNVRLPMAGWAKLA